MFDSPIPADPAPAGVTWNGLYNDYDIAQHIRFKSASGSGNGHVFLTGSANGESFTKWGSGPWPVNTSSAFMFDLDPTSLVGYNYYPSSPSLGANGDCWTLPAVLPNKLPSDPSGLCAVDAMLDASGTPGFWVVQNRLDTNQWHLTHLDAFGVNGVAADTVSGASAGGFNTIRDSLYKNAIVYGGQRHEYPLSTTYPEIGIYGKYGTHPFLITLDPYYMSSYVSGVITHYFFSARSSYNLFMKYPTLSADPAMAPDYFPYWLSSDCSRYGLPASGARFSTGYAPNYMALMGQYLPSSGLSAGRFIKGDDYGQQSSGACSGAFRDVTSTDLLLGHVNVVRSGDFGNGPGSSYANYGAGAGAVLPFTNPIPGGAMLLTSCNSNGGATYRQAPHLVAVKATSADVIISPNPARDYVNIAWGKGVDLAKDKAIVTITDVLGKQVVYETATAADGTGSRISLRAVAAGIYYISCTVNEKVMKNAKLAIIQ